MQVALKAYGETGILAHDLSEENRAGLLRALGEALPFDCLEYLEGYDSVLFIFRRAPRIAELSEWIKGINAVEPVFREGRMHQIPVIYDGPDLESVAEQLGLTLEGLIELHSASVYSVRMMGFTPGFPYLDGLDSRLQLPRRNSPRNRIEPGTVAIGGPHAGIYSVASPGGWHLLGRTEVSLFNPDAARANSPAPSEVFLFMPGDRLRFLPLR